jgi:hypothetical protein
MTKAQEQRLTDIEQLRLDVANLKRALGTTIAWITQSAASPLSVRDAELLTAMLDAKPVGGVRRKR